MPETATLYGPPAKLCPHCRSPVTNRGATFCSVSCANSHRRRPVTERFCKTCGIPLRGRQKTACSKAHTYPLAARPPSASDDAGNIAAVKRLRAAGKERKVIAREVGISKGVVQQIISKNGIPRTAAPSKRRTTNDSSPPPIRPTKRRPITIPPREVIRWAFDLGCRRDIEAVSRAIRREDPSHPGFVLGESPRGMSWSRKE